MKGAEGAADLVATWFGTALPDRCARIRARLNLPPEAFPPPALIAPHEHGPLALEEWPAVLVVPRALADMRLADTVDDGTELYLCGYQLRILCWVRGESVGETDLLRKRLTLAVRETLLSRKQLTPLPRYGSGPYGGGQYGIGVGGPDTAVRPTTIREDYSQLFTDGRHGAVIAGSWVDVQVAVLEAAEPLLTRGRADRVDLTTTHMPDTPGVHPGVTI